MTDLSDPTAAQQACISYLFVPGDRPERFDKAAASGADAVIIDLEDAVPAAAKQSARDAIARWAAQRPPGAVQLYVRINSETSEHYEDDLALMRTLPGIGVMLPKAESGEAAARAAMPDAQRPLALAIIESVAGFDAIDAIARAPGMGRLAFGSLDYAVDLGASGAIEGLLMPMTLLAHASRRAQIATPIAGVTAALDDAAQLAEDVRIARAFGFGAKLCIHPKQVAAVHRAFAPTAAELDWAQRVVEAVASGAAAAKVDGAMVDRPVVLRAQAILARVRTLD